MTVIANVTVDGKTHSKSFKDELTLRMFINSVRGQKIRVQRKAEPKSNVDQTMNKQWSGRHTGSGFKH